MYYTASAYMYCIDMYVQEAMFVYVHVYVNAYVYAYVFAYVHAYVYDGDKRTRGGFARM